MSSGKRKEKADKDSLSDSDSSELSQNKNNDAGKGKKSAAAVAPTSDPKSSGAGTGPSENDDKPRSLGGIRVVEIGGDVRLDDKERQATADKPLAGAAASANEIVNVQPLRFMLSITGLSPSRGAVSALYKAWAFACVLTACIMLFILISMNTRYRFSTITGVAIIALAPIISFMFMNFYVRGGHIDRTASIARLMDSGKSQQLKAMAAGHGFVALAASLFFAASWITITWLSLQARLNEGGVVAFMVIHTIVIPYSVGSFITCLAVFSLICNFHRLQCNGYVDAMRRNSSLSLQDLVRLHHEIKANVRYTSTAFSRWLFPSLVILSFSFLYQLYGFYRDNQVRTQYNGVYYLVAFFLVIVFIVVAGSQISAKTEGIKDAVSDVYVAAYDSRKEFGHFLTYLSTADAQFRIWAIPITPALSSYVLYAILTALGGLLHAAIY